MTKLREWKLAQKLQGSGRCGILFGMCIAALIIFVVILAIVKISWLKRHCCCNMDEFDDDCYLDANDLDENGCAYTSEKDFV